ncbi:MAG TPA: acetate kinase [Bacteroidales bacterium]|nr:acetate kinase [Bacteroidales bacterium]
MKILVLNCGSSSIKFQLFDIEKQLVMAKGGVEKLGLHGSFLKYEPHNGESVKLEGEILDHQAGIEYIMGILISPKRGVIKTEEEINAVGHRVVLGGEEFKGSVYIDNYVMQKLIEYSALAPLHNPANIKGIQAMQNILPNVPQVATFDTAFHQSMPEKAYLYAIPYSLYKKHGIRRYGFHGTSHLYVSKRACEILGKDYNNSRIITCHLGNGASITAIKDGKSVDTSMGLTPVEGLIMGTRSGDVDPGVINFVMQKEAVDAFTVNTILNKHSGILGISGVSSDMREVRAAADQNNERAKLALDMYHYRIRKYIGAYTAALEGLDILVFTGGVGENSDLTRKEVCKGFEYLGLEIDETLNAAARGKEQVINKPDSKIKVIVVPTNEELVIALDTKDIVNQRNAVSKSKLW